MSDISNIFEYKSPFGSNSIFNHLSGLVQSNDKIESTFKYQLWVTEDVNKYNLYSPALFPEAIFAKVLINESSLSSGYLNTIKSSLSLGVFNLKEEWVESIDIYISKNRYFQSFSQDEIESFLEELLIKIFQLPEIDLRSEYFNKFKNNIIEAKLFADKRTLLNVLFSSLIEILEYSNEGLKRIFDEFLGGLLEELAKFIRTFKQEDSNQWRPYNEDGTTNVKYNPFFIGESIKFQLDNFKGKIENGQKEISNLITKFTKDNNKSEKKEVFTLFGAIQELINSFTLSLLKLTTTAFSFIENAIDSIYHINAFLVGIWNGFLEALARIVEFVRGILSLTNKQKVKELITDGEQLYAKITQDGGVLQLVTEIWELFIKKYKEAESSYDIAMYIGYDLMLAIVEIVVGIFTGGSSIIKFLKELKDILIKATGSIQDVIEHLQKRFKLDKSDFNKKYPKSKFLIYDISEEILKTIEINNKKITKFLDENLDFKIQYITKPKKVGNKVIKPGIIKDENYQKLVLLLNELGIDDVKLTSGKYGQYNLKGNNILINFKTFNNATIESKKYVLLHEYLHFADYNLVRKKVSKKINADLLKDSTTSFSDKMWPNFGKLSSERFVYENLKKPEFSKMFNPSLNKHTKTYFLDDILNEVINSYNGFYKDLTNGKKRFPEIDELFKLEFEKNDRLLINELKEHYDNRIPEKFIKFFETIEVEI